MVNTVPARAPLGASTTNRKWWVDVEDPAAPGVPVGVFGIQEFKFKPAELVVQDDSDFDSNGAKSSTATASSWGGEGKLGRKTLASSATAYDPGQEILRKAAYKLGVQNRVKVRIYEMEPGGPRVEAYTGWVMVTWSPDGGNMEATDTVSFTLVGQGAMTPIAHPEDAPAAPVIEVVGPQGKAAGATIAIEGYGFTGVTGAAAVKVGATNMTSYEVTNGGKTILAVLPAGTAGATTVSVTNGSVTATVPYTRA